MEIGQRRKSVCLALGQDDLGRVPKELSCKAGGLGCTGYQANPWQEGCWRGWGWGASVEFVDQRKYFAF